MPSDFERGQLPMLISQCTIGRMLGVAKKQRRRRRVPAPVLFGLGIDPGETHFGLALLRFSAARVNARTKRGEAQRLHTRSWQPKLVDTDFEVRWAALWDLKWASGDNSGKLEDETKAIVRLIHATPVLRALLGDQRLVLFPEIQEGGDWQANPGRAQTLMRTGSLMAAFVAVFLHHGHRVEYVGKKSRWGWTSFTRTPGWKELNEEARRKRGKACITLYAKDLVRRQQQEAPDGVLYRPLSEGEWHSPRFYWRLASHQLVALICGRDVSFEDSAHYADCIVIAMFGMRRLVQPGRRHPNVIESPTWSQIAEQATARVPLWSGNRKRKTTRRNGGGGGSGSNGNNAKAGSDVEGAVTTRTRTRVAAYHLKKRRKGVMRSSFTHRTGRQRRW